MCNHQLTWEMTDEDEVPRIYRCVVWLVEWIHRVACVVRLVYRVGIRRALMNIVSVPNLLLLGSIFRRKVICRCHGNQK